MTRTPEDKHQKFLRLMNKRLARSIEDMRLVGQLSSENYENDETEAEEVIRHLDNSVVQVAKEFGVPYSTAIGAAAAHRAIMSGHLITSNGSTGKIDEVDIAKAIDLIKRNRNLDAIELLRGTLA